MSTFTNRTTGNEIARNFFSGLKSYAFQRLRDFASTDKDWNALLSAISTWDEATVENEIKQFTAKYKSAATDFRFTVLRTVKTLQVSEGSKSNMRLRPQDLDRIDLKQFFGSFMRSLTQCHDVSESKSTFKRLSPSDRNVIAEDIFRSLIYGVAHDIKDCLITTEASEKSRRSRRSHVTTTATSEEEIISDEEEEEEQVLRADDSVSVAPSEAISEMPGKTSNALSAQLLSLHNKSMKSKKSSMSRRTKSPSKLPKQFVQIDSSPHNNDGGMPVAAPPEEIEVMVPSSRGASRKTSNRSKFSRSPRRSTQKRDTDASEKPYFFQSESTRQPQSMSTRVTRL